MPAHIVIIDFFLVVVGFLFKADAHIGAVAVELAERQLDHPLQVIDNKEYHKQTFYLLSCVGFLVTLHPWREFLSLTLPYDDPRP